VRAPFFVTFPAQRQKVEILCKKNYVIFFLLFYSEMETKKSFCVGCSKIIHDQYILRVAPDLEWHAACLKCQECHQFLDENCTCFVRDGKTYCKRDYVRLFGTKCDKCGSSFSKNDFVMRAKSKIYHVKCFRCTACEIQLNPGDEFALRESGLLYCKNDHDQMSLDSSKNETIMQDISNDMPKPVLCNIKRSTSSDFASLTGEQFFHFFLHISPTKKFTNFPNFLNFYKDSDSESDSYRSCNTRRDKPSQTLNGKPARVRTVLNEKQLSMLRACYQINSRPDALVKEQLVEMTGLSPRVVRVWFQNKVNYSFYTL
jgi:insulin gene enhancer protein ISL-1